MRKPINEAASLMRAISSVDAPPPDGRVEANARTRFTVAKALAQGRVRFQYQPVVRAAAPQRPAFYEMLARLEQPGGQMLPAAQFLPLVASGLLGRSIDRLALAHAVASLRADPALRLSVNVAVESMGDAEWLQTLEAAARAPGICQRLILEIDEAAALVDTSQTIDFMNFARGFGCAFALDHFGAGATGLRHFRAFRFDMVKLDGGFVQGISRARDAQVLVECLMAVARHFEMFTIAERVEAQEDADWLRDLGVDCLQGHFCGLPLAEPLDPRPAQPVADRAAAG